MSWLSYYLPRSLFVACTGLPIFALTVEKEEYSLEHVAFFAYLLTILSYCSEFWKELILPRPDLGSDSSTRNYFQPHFVNIGLSIKRDLDFTLKVEVKH